MSELGKLGALSKLIYVVVNPNCLALHRNYPFLPIVQSSEKHLLFYCLAMVRIEIFYAVVPFLMHQASLQ